jgi:RNA polymerase sigma-70 factor (ECF subfamily)
MVLMDKAASGEANLMERMRAGDPDALSEFYELYAGRVLGLSQRILGDGPQAEDVTQEVFLHVWQRAGGYLPLRASPLPWLLAITRNLCIDHLRRQKSRPQTEPWAAADWSRDELLPDPGGSTFDAVALEDQLRRVRQAVAALAPEQQVVIELSYFRGLTRREIAHELRWPEGTVHTRARSALNALRLSLARAGLESLA